MELSISACCSGVAFLYSAGNSTSTSPTMKICGITGISSAAPKSSVGLGVSCVGIVPRPRVVVAVWPGGAGASTTSPAVGSVATEGVTGAPEASGGIPGVPPSGKGMGDLRRGLCPACCVPDGGLDGGGTGAGSIAGPAGTCRGGSPSILRG